tara:strand:+ start:3105 stop:3806 length:702 start_codon:yes stop_codon:yes gene_type:complete
MPPKNYYQAKKSNWSTGKSTSRSAGANQGFNQFSRKSKPANISPKPVKQTKSSFSFFPTLDIANKIIKSIPSIKVRPAKLPDTRPRGTIISTTPTKDGKSKINTFSKGGKSKIVTTGKQMPRGNLAGASGAIPVKVKVSKTKIAPAKNLYSSYTRPKSETFEKNTPKRNLAAKRQAVIGAAMQMFDKKKKKVNSGYGHIPQEVSRGTKKRPWYSKQENVINWNKKKKKKNEFA